MKSIQRVCLSSGGVISEELEFGLVVYGQGGGRESLRKEGNKNVNDSGDLWGKTCMKNSDE